ncbi:Protein N-acetyltransferase, RimJ/RimL family [Clostridium sp. DSM 8431]|uniref:GNAT family N-acetyltransferase n=1 Tax=Clostridium sp. DSM 8431 TaxID=1761781 RepID=UPI0008E9EADE|nr:GNAT family N-acetyltransferase [Clostridium sp. DSM 8431]SFU79669.1 Protein N-acetyltransferase, RimJ/RimL family [Clostridium sp. DSM 8431]
MILKTERLILRPWREEDSKDLYEHAKNPNVGPTAGFPPHKNVEESLEVIKNVLSKNINYAIILKETNKAIGSIGILIGKKSSLAKNNEEGEIGYWIAETYWGQGLMPEAVKEIIRYAFQDLKLLTLWCGYYEGNKKSKRVQDKCGFKYDHTEKDKLVPLLNERRNEITTKLTKIEWIK